MRAPTQPDYIKQFDKGTVIVPEGSRTDEMYVLLRGSASVYKNYQQFNQAELEALRIGGTFGEASLFLNQETPGSLVAVDAAAFIVINAKNYPDVFTRQPDIAYSIIGRICRKLDAAVKQNESLRQRLHGPAADSQASQGSSLFPEGHGSYILPIRNDLIEYLYTHKLTCPICGHDFESMAVLTSRLRRESTDKDLRVHYAGIEPMYYDVVSCQKCLYSAPADLFPTASQKFGERINKELNQFLPQVEIKDGTDRDTFTVFAGYYLAIRCVPVCFDDYQLPLAGLWQKLSRIYKDCADEDMYVMASQNALKYYEHVYQNFPISEKQSQQICYIIGDLYERLKNYEKARNFYFLAKSNRDGTPAMKLQADRRLEEIKELMKQG